MPRSPIETALVANGVVPHLEAEAEAEGADNNNQRSAEPEDNDDEEGEAIEESDDEDVRHCLLHFDLSVNMLPRRLKLSWNSLRGRCT